MCMSVSKATPPPTLSKTFIVDVEVGGGVGGDVGGDGWWWWLVVVVVVMTAVDLPLILPSSATCN